MTFEISIHHYMRVAIFVGRMVVETSFFLQNNVVLDRHMIRIFIFMTNDSLKLVFYQRKHFSLLLFLQEGEVLILMIYSNSNFMTVAQLMSSDGADPENTRDSFDICTVKRVSLIWNYKCESCDKSFSRPEYFFDFRFITSSLLAHCCLLAREICDG